MITDTFASSVKNLIPHVKTEDDLRIGVEKILHPILVRIGMDTDSCYERFSSEAAGTYRGRPDAVHGQVIIEYKKPGTFSSQNKIAEASEQLVGYMKAQAGSAEALKKLVGVGFDGQYIFFVRYDIGLSEKAGDPMFARQGIYGFDIESAKTFLTYLHSLAYIPLTAENLARIYGSDSRIAKLAMSAFSDALENWGNPKTQTFFSEWQRLFGIIYGEQNTDPGLRKSLFSIHTYFAFLMKLIAAELLTFYDTDFGSSFSEKLTHSSSDELKQHLDDIESGGIYARRGITNFLEGDFFCWYREAWSPKLEDAIREITRAFSQFEFSPSSADAEPARDLLKKLYQYLVPQEIRHKLGEYYTPDWLAELVIDETGYDGNTDARFLDPACGSGTFLVFAIRKARAYAQKHGAPPSETAEKIVRNIWGFDLNPLAVIAARTNYLFAMGDLAKYLDRLEIPIYLTDSVLTPTGIRSGIFGKFSEISTSVGKFQIPSEWIDNQGRLMNIAMPLLENMVRQRYKTEEAMQQFQNHGLVSSDNINVVLAFYNQIATLEKEGRDGIWARFLKNAFAPAMAGKFDVIAGNPPWIRFGYLSRDYRNITFDLWKSYGLFSLSGRAGRLGGGDKDFSMLFLYAVSDYYLKNGGRLGFLITQEIFKSKGAGEGFRRFRIGNNDFLKVIKAHDFVSIQPFEGAANKTAAIILSKGEATTYPVPYIVWTKQGAISSEMNLKEVKTYLINQKLLASPMGDINGSWQTIRKDQKSLSEIYGKNPYQARLGAKVDPYGVFLTEIKQVLSDGDVIIHNLPEKGKKDIPKIEERIESGLVFPIVRGSDIERWKAISRVFAIMPQNPSERKPYPESFMKDKYPRTYGYLVRFRDILLSRKSNTIRQLAERTAFYAMFGIGDYTVARYKVIWKRMAKDIISAVISQYRTVLGYKLMIPGDTTSFFPTDNESEAHYLCAIINSSPVREFIRSYSSAGRGFGTPSVMEHVGIPKFDMNQTLHIEIANLSKRLHILKAEDNLSEIAELEKKTDEKVNSLFNLR